MITRSGRKKNCTPMSEVTPLSSINKKKAKINSANKAKKFTKSPVVEESNERNTQNVQSPVFNIHVHMPSVPNDLNESCQVQPVIHLHFGDVISRLSSGSTSQHAGTGKSFKVESLSELNNNFEEQNNSHEEIVEMSSEKSETCKRLTFEDLNGNNRDLETEEPEIVLVPSNSLKGNEFSKKPLLHKSKPPGRKKASLKNKMNVPKENWNFKSNVVFKNGSPLRRSPRVANNLKLLETIKAITVKQSKSGKHKSKKCCKTSKYKKKSGQILNPFTLKEPMVVLCDKCRVHDNDKKENITGCNSTNSVSVDIEDNTGLVDENPCEKNYSGSVNESCSSNIETEIHETQCSSDAGGPSDDEEYEIQNGGLACDSATDVDEAEKLNITSNYESSSKNEDSEEDGKKTLVNESSSEGEENKTDVKKASSDESLLSLGRKSGKVYSAIYTSDNEESCGEDNSSDVEENSARVNCTSTACSVESSARDSCVQGKEHIRPNKLELMITNEGENNNSNVLPNNEDQLLNVESGTGRDGANYSNGSSISGNLETDLDEIDSDLSYRADSEEDNEQTPLAEEWDLDKSHLENENNNSLKIVEDECLSKSDDCEEISKTSPGVQLELFKKDMKTRKTTKEERSLKSALKKKKLSQISGKEPDNSPMAKKIKLTNGAEVSVKNTTKKSVKETSRDFIPLQVSGPTKFAVARLNSLKAHEHKAKNFKAEMLFGKRVARFSDSNHLQTYKLKKQAAAKRKKMSK